MAFFLIPIVLLLLQPAESRVVSAIANFVVHDTGARPPLLLSQTGLYRNITATPRVLTDSIHPFEVNAPLWSDGSHKERFIQVPFGTRITPTDTARYTFPNGTVLIKNFAIDTVVGDTTTRILVETRFLVVWTLEDNPYFSGLTYRWRRNQRDADLVTHGNGEDVIHNVNMGGVPRGKRWHYPSRDECNSCHVNEWRGSLGFITPQLNRPVRGNPSLNQLQDLFNKGVLASNPIQGKPNAFRWRALDDQGASLRIRARSYLAANCSHCHGNGPQKAWGQHSFDYFDSAQTIAYNETTDAGMEGYVGKDAMYFDTTTPMFIYPGRPDSSFIVKRLVSRGTFELASNAQMPPLATYQIDSAAVKVIRDWVCDLRTPATPAASCMVPKVDYEPYTGPLAIHRDFPAGRSGFKAFFQDGEVRVVYGHALPWARVDLFDAKGRQLGLAPAGFGAFKVQTQLRAGLYFLKVGNRVLRMNHLP